RRDQGRAPRGRTSAPAHGALSRGARPPLLHREEPGRSADPAAGVRRGLRHAGRRLRPAAGPILVDPRPLAARRAARATRMPAVLRMLPEPAAVPDEQYLDGRGVSLPLGGAHPGSRRAAAAQPGRHGDPVLPALLHVPGRHGALLDLDQRLPARGPRARPAARPARIPRPRARIAARGYAPPRIAASPASWSRPLLANTVVP